MTNIKTYSELLTFDNFEDRFRYLEIGGLIGERTFGGNRYLNQRFYSSYKWRKLRDEIIVRDEGCDLGLPGFEQNWRITVHHINPVTEEDIIREAAGVFDPENLICVSYNTHKAIHYGQLELCMSTPAGAVRKPNDTCPWKE